MKWYEWTRYIRDHCDAPPDVKHLLLTMSTYADAAGRCWPSLATLAEKLNVHPDTAKRRRNKAVELGWLTVESPGRWVGTPTRYKLNRKGGVDAPLHNGERGASVGGRGVHEAPGKGGVDAPRTYRTFHEGDNDAPSMARSSPTEQRRLLARHIREATDPAFKERFRQRFLKEYGPLYPGSSHWGRAAA